MNRQEKFNSLIEDLKVTASSILPQGSRVVLYGSRARGDARDDSDWDLHVLVPGSGMTTIEEEDRYAAPFFFTGLKHGEIVNARLYTEAGWLKRSFLPFYKNVEHDKVLIYQK